MRIASAYTDGVEKAFIVDSGLLYAVEELAEVESRDWPRGLEDILTGGALEDIRLWYGERGGIPAGIGGGIAVDGAAFAPPYRRPGKIWGIGLNYREHAGDLCETCLEGEPGSFMKPFTSIIGHGDTVRIPPQSRRTTAEAELGVIIGRECLDIDENDWLDYVAGFTCVLDMTAEDILRRNVRYLARSKSFDTFFAFGPVIVTTDEIEDIGSLEVSTVLNGKVRASNTVSNMTFSPRACVAAHSRSMTLLPGDIISTGTPGAAAISPGDRVECRIAGFPPLACGVDGIGPR